MRNNFTTEMSICQAEKSFLQNFEKNNYFSAIFNVLFQFLNTDAMNFNGQRFFQSLGVSRNKS